MTSKSEGLCIYCLECSGAWGVVGDTDECYGHLAAMLYNAWGDRWREEKGDDWPEKPPAMQVPSLIMKAQLVWVSEASASWLGENGIWEPAWADGCWLDVDEHEVPPMWWCRPRMIRSFRARACRCDHSLSALARLLDPVAAYIDQVAPFATTVGMELAR